MDPLTYALGPTDWTPLVGVAFIAFLKQEISSKWGQFVCQSVRHTCLQICYIYKFIRLWHHECFRALLVLAVFSCNHEVHILVNSHLSYISPISFLLIILCWFVIIIKSFQRDCIVSNSCCVHSNGAGIMKYCHMYLSFVCLSFFVKKTVSPKQYVLPVHLSVWAEKSVFRKFFHFSSADICQSSCHTKKRKLFLFPYLYNLVPSQTGKTKNLTDSFKMGPHLLDPPTLEVGPIDSQPFVCSFRLFVRSFGVFPGNRS